MSESLPELVINCAGVNPFPLKPTPYPQQTVLVFTNTQVSPGGRDLRAHETGEGGGVSGVGVGAGDGDGTSSR